METIALLDLHKANKDVLLQLYCRRPPALIVMDFGQWFCLATGVKDETLKNLNYPVGVMYVNNADYDAIPHLIEKLSAFNSFYKV